MIDGIEPFYQQITTSIVEAMPEAWTLAWIEAIFYPDSVSYSGEYLTAQGSSPKSFPTTVESERAFRRIRDLFKQAGKAPWCRARFELHPDGKFKMNWSYDDCDENGFAKFDADPDVVV